MTLPLDGSNHDKFRYLGDITERLVAEVKRLRARVQTLEIEVYGCPENIPRVATSKRTGKAPVSGGQGQGPIDLKNYERTVNEGVAQQYEGTTEPSQYFKDKEVELREKAIRMQGKHPPKPKE